MFACDSLSRIVEETQNGKPVDSAWFAQARRTSLIYPNARQVDYTYDALGSTMTHDYKRNGTATLFAALNTLDGTVIGMCQERHRHPEWLKFLRVIDDLTPAGMSI